MLLFQRTSGKLEQLLNSALKPFERVFDTAESRLQNFLTEWRKGRKKVIKLQMICKRKNKKPLIRARLFIKANKKVDQTITHENFEFLNDERIL